MPGSSMLFGLAMLIVGRQAPPPVSSKWSTQMKGPIAMIGIGTTLYRFNENRRVYEYDENRRAKGGPIYAEHFEPVEIHGETKVSWLCGPSYSVSKVNKKEIQSGRAGSYFTAEGMADNIWTKSHRHRIRDLVDVASADQLRQIASIVGYKP